MAVKIVRRESKSGISINLQWVEFGKRRQTTTGLVLIAGTTKDVKAQNQKTIALAEQMRLKKELELAEGKTTRKVPTLLAFFDTILRRRRLNDKLTFATVKMWNQSKVYLSEFLSEIGRNDLKMDELTIGILADFKTFLISKGLATSTINLYQEKLKAVCSEGVQEGYLEQKIIASIRPAKVSREPVKYLNDDQIQTILSVDWETKMEVCLGFRWTILTGFRISDVANLRWSNVDVKKKTISIITQKTHSHLTIPITDKMMVVLNKAKELWGEDSARHDDRVFGPLRAKSYDQSFKYWQKKCGINDIKLRWHLGRDTFANYLIRHNVDIFTVSKALTHSSVQVTQQAYVTDASQQMIADALSKF